MAAGGVLGGDTGVMVHDDWAPYRTCVQATTRCAERTWSAIWPRSPSGLGWAAGMRHLLLEAAERTAAARAAGQTALEPGVVAGSTAATSS